MARPLRMLVVCQNERPPEARISCRGIGGEAFLDAVRQELVRLKVKGPLRAVGSTCLGACEGGPHAVVYPDNVWYAGFSPDDAVEIVHEHLLAGRPVERLRVAWPPTDAAIPQPPSVDEPKGGAIDAS